MDVRNETGLSLPFVVVHEGTGERPVSLTVSVFKNQIRSILRFSTVLKTNGQER